MPLLPTPSFASPIRFVLRHVPYAPTAIAPEKEAALRQIADGVSLNITDDGDWVCNYNTKTKVITLSRHLVELLWCGAYAYVVVYQVIYEGRMELEPKTFDLRATPELKAASSLLQWAYEKHFNKDDPPWPMNLPHPTNNPAPASMENVADELTGTSALGKRQDNFK